MIRNYMSPRSSITITNDLVVWLEQNILLTKDGYNNLRKNVNLRELLRINPLIPYIRTQ